MHQTKSLTLHYCLEQTTVQIADNDDCKYGKTINGNLETTTAKMKLLLTTDALYYRRSTYSNMDSGKHGNMIC